MYSYLRPWQDSWLNLKHLREKPGPGVLFLHRLRSLHDKAVREGPWGSPGRPQGGSRGPRLARELRGDARVPCHTVKFGLVTRLQMSKP